MTTNAPARSYAELVVGRPLRRTEQAIDVLGLDQALNQRKDELHQAIEAEKKRALVRRRRTGFPIRLEVTRAMLTPLERLHRLGRREALAELDRLGYPIRRSYADAEPEIPDLDVLAGRLRSGLSGLSVRLEGEYVQQEVAGVAHDAIARALLRVPGGRAIAADLVSTALFSGLAVTFEEHADLVECWEYTAVLDAGTCDVCAPLDGTEYQTLDELFEVLPDFGPHPDCFGGGRCRCRAVPCAAAGS